MTHSYSITGMTCNGCVAKVKSELLKLPQVTAASVQLEAPQATVTMQQHITTAALQAAISKAGAFRIEEAESPMHESVEAHEEPGNSYLPIFLIFAYITGATLLVQLAGGSFSLMAWMSHFMGGFFLVFSFFKLMNLRGFADGYRMYDVVARAVPAYAFIYPFIELALGIAFITGFNPVLTNTVTLVVMAVSTVGVIQNLLKPSPIQCACLGTVIRLPLSKVTLAEDLLMVLMSAGMLAIYTLG
jgi:copper chaperone CopZ